MPLICPFLNTECIESACNFSYHVPGDVNNDFGTSECYIKSIGILLNQSMINLIDNIEKNTDSIKGDMSVIRNDIYATKEALNNLNDLYGTDSSNNPIIRDISILNSSINNTNTSINTMSNKISGQEDNISIISSINNVANKISNDIGDETIIEKLESIIDTQNDSYDLDRHIHNNHNHALIHGVNNTEIGIPGSHQQQDISSITLANQLCSEFISNIDVDGNGKIYGYDFKMIDNEHCPTILKTLENMEAWQDPELEVDWNEFKEDINMVN